MDNWELYYRTHKDKGSNAITGVPPLTFVSNGENLVDYRIYGASGGVGDRTANLFDKNAYLVGGTRNPNPTLTTNYRNIIKLKQNTTYTMSSNVPYIPGENHLYIYINNYASSVFATVYAGQPATVTTGEKGFLYFEYAKRTYYEQLRDGTFFVMLVEGAVASSTYIPYGYRIPIVCGETTTNIYLDEPLEENESISMSDTGVSIPTINGSNTLSIGTTVQPSNMYIKYGGSGNINQSLMTYLEYKYNVAKE